MNPVKLAALIASAAVFLSACSSTPVAPPPPPPAPAPVQAPAPAPAPAPQVTALPAPPPALPAYLDPKSPIATERSIYFDYDDYTVKGEFSAMVERHGKFLAAHPAVSIKVEGNADERGSREYNLALGQKRADAVVRALKVYGAKDAQMEAVSWGKEKPKDPGHDEAAWARNRRVDLQYPNK